MKSQKWAGCIITMSGVMTLAVICRFTVATGFWNPQEQTRFITRTGGLHDRLGLYRGSDAVYNGDLKADGTPAKSTH